MFGIDIQGRIVGLVVDGEGDVDAPCLVPRRSASPSDKKNKMNDLESHSLLP
jgi:hypothetical protein